MVTTWNALLILHQEKSSHNFILICDLFFLYTVHLCLKWPHFFYLEFCTCIVFPFDVKFLEARSHAYFTCFTWCLAQCDRQLHSHCPFVHLLILFISQHSLKPSLSYFALFRYSCFCGISTHLSHSTHLVECWISIRIACLFSLIRYAPFLRLLQVSTMSSVLLVV